MDDLIQSDKLYVALRDALGVTLEDPKVMTLGRINPDTGVQETKVPDGESDLPNLYYFSNLPEMQSAEGEALLHSSADIPYQYRIFGMPIRVARDIQSGLWVIRGLDAVLSNEYLAGVEETPPQQPIALHQFLPGLLDATDPPSLQARVLGSWYTFEDESYYVRSQATADFSGTVLDTSSASIDIPTVVNTSIYVLVQIVPSTGVLTYKQGASIQASFTHDQAIAYEYVTGEALGYYFPQVDVGNFRCGFIRLIYGMTTIRRIANIWASHEILVKGDAHPVYVTSEGHIVVDSDGDMVEEG
jgi:hypothetical protein